MAAGNVWKFNLVGAGPDSEELVTTLGYVESTGSVSLTMGSIQAFVDAFSTGFLPTYLLAITSVYTHNYLEMVAQVGGFGLFARSNVLRGTSGTSTGTPGTIERCTLIQKTTGMTGRNQRGRMFVPCCPSELYDFDGIINTGAGAVVTAATALATAMVSHFVFAGTIIQPCIYPPSPFGVPAVSLVQACQVRQHVGIQRRRRAGHGA